MKGGHATPPKAPTRFPEEPTYRRLAELPAIGPAKAPTRFPEDPHRKALFTARGPAYDSPMCPIAMTRDER